jgi:hypothetical protein
LVPDKTKYIFSACLSYRECGSHGELQTRLFGKFTVAGEADGEEEMGEERQRSGGRLVSQARGERPKLWWYLDDGGRICRMQRFVRYGNKETQDSI